MKQIISVRAIIRQDDKTLLLRRANGRQSILGKYELPGGSLSYGEQPDDALKRYVQTDTALIVQAAQLFDVLTYIDNDDRDIQYTFILYIVSLAKHSGHIKLSNNYNRYLWQQPSKIQPEEVTESAKLLLGISQQQFLTTVKDESDLQHSQSSHSDAHFTIYSDGGSRGNPGPSASGFVVLDDHQEVIEQGGVYLGITTNNQAEYHGVRVGLEKALKMKAKTIDFRIDSLLVVNQLNGIYKIKNRELWPIHERIKELETKFDKVQYTHVRREFNQLADGMVNKILDEHQNSVTK